MSASRAQLRLESLRRALNRLGEALEEPEDSPLNPDGTIQRFEFVFELCWKTLALVLAEEGIAATTPREVLRAAFAAELITAEDGWLEMLEARNLTSHAYDERLARRVYIVIRRSFPVLHAAVASLEAKLGSSSDG